MTRNTLEEIDAAFVRAEAARREHGQDSKEYHEACEILDELRRSVFWRGDGSWVDDV